MYDATLFGDFFQRHAILVLISQLPKLGFELGPELFRMRLVHAGSLSDSDD
jgi:hypothetical protein